MISNVSPLTERMSNILIFILSRVRVVRDL
jgi:hypothetical protein